MYSMFTTPSASLEPTGFDLAGVAISLGAGIVLWLVASFLIARITKRVASGTSLFKKPHFRRVQRANTIGSLLKSGIGVIIAVITSIYILKNLDVDVAPLLTSVGILGIAIGFGAQQLIRDFLAGIFITIEDQYGIGDIIETSEVVGVVESIGLRITRVRDENGAIWYLRNGEILRVGNRSQGNYVPPAEPEETAVEAEHAPQQKAGE
jgi:moderate conductance mechanosensitive channel